jgi:hypothetical protein
VPFTPQRRFSVSAQLGKAMNREYDIFERLPDGRIFWRDFVVGLETARSKLGELGSSSKNEFFAIHTPTKDIAARVNVSEQPRS